MKSRSTRVRLSTRPLSYRSCPTIAIWLQAILLACSAFAAETTRIFRGDGTVMIEWSGTGGLVQLQALTGLGLSTWRDVGGLTDAAKITVPANKPTEFFRVRVVPSAIVFRGGTLSDLAALSPTLVFDALLIDGSLELPNGASVLLRVSSLTISTNGNISYRYPECLSASAPNITIEASNRVAVLGDILLGGEFGRRQTASATCKSCSGKPGGNLSISAKEVLIAGRVDTSGGGGGTSVSLEGGSFGCDGGSGGRVDLRADRIFLARPNIGASGGIRGTGSYAGQATPGSDGTAGAVNLTASDLIHMRGGTIRNGGPMTLRAAHTDIYGQLNYSSLDELIGGARDTGPPMVEILSPTEGGQVALDRAFQIRMRVSDTGTGVREVKVVGLGYDSTNSAAEINEGILSIILNPPGLPAALTVTAWDNKGQASSTAVSNLVLRGNLTVPQGTVFQLANDLDLGTEAVVNIAGSLLVKRGVHSTLTAGTFRLAPSGAITMEPATSDADITNTPSLRLEISDLAQIDGEVELSGHDSFSGRNYDFGENGASFEINAGRIEIGGDITANGGNGFSYPFGFPTQYIGQGGGNGGSIMLRSRNDILVTGSLTANGGSSANTGLGLCFDGGDGGTTAISYTTTANLTNAAFTMAGGTANRTAFRCDEVVSGMPGTVAATRLRSAAVEDVIVPELEPNEFVAQAQEVFPTRLTGASPPFVPTRILATMNPADAGDIVITYTDNTRNDLEDLFAVRIPSLTRLRVELISALATELDLLLIRENSTTQTLEILTQARQSGNSLIIDPVNLQPGTYMLGVAQLDGLTPGLSAYTVDITPSVVP